MQGCYGETLDNCIVNLPNDISHIKIDVDGNENLILKGGKKALTTLPLKSILIELDENRSDYYSSLEIIKSCGFRLFKKTHSTMFDQTRFSTTYNHIFHKIV